MLAVTPLRKTRSAGKHASADAFDDLKELMPQRNSLVGQIVEAIQSGIQKNVWQEWLPPERDLAETLHVSRSTLRAALTQLEKMGIVRAERPLGTRILSAGAPRKRPVKTRVVAMLTPEPITALRPTIALIVDELRAQLAELGYRLHTFHGEHYFAAGAHARLQRLVSENPHDCWVLTLVPASVKQWFQEQGIPCVVSGTCDPNINLPYVDLDFYALCRHAAGQMTALGHKKIVFLTEQSTKAGDLESERGFIDGVAAASDSETKGIVVHHQNTMRSSLKVLDKLFDGEERPTAMLIANPHFYLLVLTYLYGRGLRVPDDISLMCRDYDSFLEYTRPSPTRYSFELTTFARRLFKLIMQTMDGTPILKGAIRIMPDYHKGATLAAPPAPDDAK